MGEGSLDLLRVSLTFSPLAQGKSLRIGASSVLPSERSMFRTVSSFEERE
jgi:hypothetical protein